jgi:hypothetical protein
MTMEEADARLIEVAKRGGSRYTCVTYERSRFVGERGGDMQEHYILYSTSYGHYSGSTWEAAFELLEAAIEKRIKAKEDVPACQENP